MYYPLDFHVSKDICIDNITLECLEKQVIEGSCEAMTL